MRLPAALLTVLTAALLAGCGAGDSTPAAGPGASSAADTEQAPPAEPEGATAEVSIEGFKFAPQSITVETGTAVSWTNEDTAAHTATLSEGGEEFDTGTLDEGQTGSVTFDTPGTYAYICAFHPYMKGELVVEG